jgi:UDP-N-acetylglucosamine:LPS N-acetylglucosamine transferase
MSRTVMIMAGGTGGHIYPALAVGDALRAKGWNAVWLGTRNGMEAQLVPAHGGYEMAWVSIKGLRGKGFLRLLATPALLLLAMMQSARAIFRHRPDVVIGFGGYTALPGGLMASLLAKPLAIHEQNSIAGLTNRVLAGLADRVLVAFPDPFGERVKDEGGRMKGGLKKLISSFIPHPSSLELVGNPVRAEIGNLAEPEQRFAGREGKLKILVVGGSLGAAALNETLPKALALIPAEQRPLVKHQAGKANYDKLQALYRDAGVEAEVLPFIDDMAAEYAACDLTICRAGALTVAELAAAGVASILVPFPHAVDDHQTGNARFLSEQGAAILLPQTELSAEKLARTLNELNRDRLLAMAQAARKLGKPDATDLVARACEELAK